MNKKVLVFYRLPITGSLAGLFIGGEHLPKEWVDSLQAKDNILQIVDRFYEQYK